METSTAGVYHRVSGRATGGPSLLFVHGLACDHTDWAAQVAHFEANHRCIAVDLPGHGRTPADGPISITRCADEVAALAAAEDAPVVIVGHSMGCRVALVAAERVREQAQGLVLIDGSTMAAGEGDTVRAQTLAQLQAVGFRDTLETLFEPMFTPASPRRLVDGALARARAFDPVHGPGLIADMLAWDADESAGVLARATAPILAIQSTRVDCDRRRHVLAPGEGSPWTDRLAREATASAGVRIEYVPGVGHFTMIEAPARVNRLLETFLDVVGDDRAG